MAACTVGDFKKMIETMNISDDVVIECVEIRGEYELYGVFEKADFTCNEYTGRVSTNNVYYDGMTISIGDK